MPKAKVRPPGVIASIPRMPALYTSKHKQKFLPWKHAEERLVKSRSYWVCTTRPDGRPHSMPVWGIWLDGELYFGTGLETRKAKNIAHNPAISVHVGDGDDMVVIEGKAFQGDLADRMLCARLDAEYKRKYKMPMLGMPDSIVYRVQPRVVLAWLEKSFPFNATRWEFP